MHVTWDPNKAEINFKRHGVRFSDADAVLSDPLAMTLEEHVVANEQRFVTVGADAVGSNNRGCLFIPSRYHPFNFGQKGDIKGKETI